MGNRIGLLPFHQKYGTRFFCATEAVGKNQLYHLFGDWLDAMFPQYDLKKLVLNLKSKLPTYECCS